MKNNHYLKVMLKIPYIKVSDVNEYFSLPKKEREVFGFYKKPYALPWNLFNDEDSGWETFYKEIKKQYPVQWIFREWLFSSKNPVYFMFSKYIKWPYFELKSKIRLLMNPIYPRWRKTISRCEYADLQYVIVESNLNIILDFYHEEVVDGYVDWESDDVHKKFYDELISNVKWIEVDRQKWIEEKDNELMLASKNRKEKDFHKKYEQYEKYEQLIFDKESQILKWMIDNRKFFWT